MTDRDLMKQALDAMLTVTDYDALHAAKIALRKRLAQPEQKPTGYWDGEFSDDGGATLYEVPQKSLFGRKYPNIPLYTTPPAAQRQPLTDEEIMQTWEGVIKYAPGEVRLKDFARALEAAHGIKENT